jgi:hypothetical protein
MFTQISWSSYIVTVVLLLVSYYLVIAYWYYRHDLLQLIVGKNTTNNVAAFTQRHTTLVQSFVDEVQAFMAEARRNKLDKRDILLSLPLLLKKYPTFMNSAFHESVQNLIINECISYCSIALSGEELSALWI